MRRLRTPLRLAFCVSALTLLVGCEASGRIDARPDDSVVVDVTVTFAAAERPRRDCPSVEVLTLQQTPDAAGVTCHYAGTLTAEARRLSSMFGFRHIGDEILVQNPTFHQFRGAGREAALRRLSAVDIDLTFPGPIIAHEGGTADGTTLHWTDPADLSRASGAWVLAADAPDVPVGRYACAASAVVGALAASGLGIVASRRRRGVRPAQDADASGELSGVTGEPAVPSPRPDESDDWGPG